MQIYSVSPVNFCGPGNKITALAKAEERNVRKAVYEAAQKRHPDDRATYIREHMDKYREEKSKSLYGNFDMQKVLEPTEHDKKMNRLRRHS